MIGARGRLARIAIALSAAAAAGEGATLSAAAQAPEQTPAPQAETSSNITAYKPDFFTQFRPNTAMDMIGRIPGFSFDGGSGARGFSGTGGNVLIDGERPPSRGDSLSSIIARIPASGVDRIDVIRGGAEGIDMQGKAIVANIIRKKDAGLTGSLNSNVNVNSFGGVSPNATLALRNQSGSNLLDGSLGLFHNQSNGTSRRYRVEPDGDVALLSWIGSDNQFDSAEATGAWETLLLGGKLRVNGKVAYEQFAGHVEEGHRVAPTGTQLTEDDNHNWHGEGGVRWARSFNGTEIELVGFQSFFDEETYNDSDGPRFTSENAATEQTGESILRSTVKLPAFGAWSFDGGAEGVFNFSETNNVRLQAGAPLDLTGDANRVEELRGELFGTATWKPTTQLSVEAGLRFEGSQIKSENETDTAEKSLTYLKPRLNVSWSPTTGEQWGFGIERVVDQLNFDAFASSASIEDSVFGVGNVDIEPQKNWVLNARYEHQFGGQNSFVVSFEHVTIEDFLARTFVTVSGPPQSFPEITRNAGTATKDKLALDSSFELDNYGMPGGIFKLGGNVRTSSVTDPVTNEDRQLSAYWPWEWNVSLQQTLDGGNFRWGVFLEDDADFANYSVRSYQYVHNGLFLGANITWKPTANWTIGGGVNNIIAEDGTNYTLFYDEPSRGTGALLYRQDQSYESRRQFFFNARLNF